MSNPLWMLVPWLVFALAASIKCWRLKGIFRMNRRHALQNRTPAADAGGYLGEGSAGGAMERLGRSRHRTDEYTYTNK
ncbi:MULTISPECIES: hypothetical protein [Cyanobium]|uniref:hypothetical protein n=1 Tax=Cyanobium TaxID=167375 RepID=UPI0019D4A823|nr:MULTISPECIES: hypothetical protein [Cyanobium]MCP9822350.1 hypothetical protein [Cyanobium sp. L1E-Cus]